MKQKRGGKRSSLAKFGEKARKEVKKYSKYSPLGIKILVAYSLLLFVVNLVFLLFLDSVLVMGFSISGAWAKIVYGGFCFVLALLMFGYVRRGLWAFYYAVLWYSFSIIDSFISLFSLKFVNFNSNVFLFFLLLVMLVNGLTLGYVSMKKKYFEGKKNLARVAYEDKLFISVLGVFIIGLLILSISGGVLFYQETKHAIDSVSVELDQKNKLQAEIICGSKHGKKADVCYMVLARSIDTNNNYCSYIQNAFYRFICDKSIGE